MSYTVDQLVNLLGRNSDREGWLQPLLDDPDSAAIVRAALAILSRSSEAVDRTAAAGSISESSGGDSGTSVLTLTRAAGGTSGTLPVGYPFTDARGVRVVSQTPVPVGALELSISVPVQTLRKTEAVNSEDDPGFSFPPTALVVLATGGASVLFAPPGTAGLVSTSFSTVAVALPIQGGAADWLSQHGRERGVRRQPNEATSPFRLRVRNIPDAVSPIAVADGAEAVALQASLPQPTVLEPFNDGATAALKVDHGLGSFSGVYLSGTDTPSIASSPKADFFDDAGQDHEIVGLREGRAYLRVEVPQPRNPDGLGLFFDEGFFDDPALGYPDLGTHPAVIAALMSVWEEVERKSAAGVQHDVYVTGVTRRVGHGHAVNAGEVVAFTLTPTAGFAWLLREAWADHDTALSAPGTLVNPATMHHRVRFTFTDASTFTTAAFSGVDSERFEISSANMVGYPWGKRMSQIQGLVTGDGVADVNMVLTAFLLQVVDP